MDRRRRRIERASSWVLATVGATLVAVALAQPHDEVAVGAAEASVAPDRTSSPPRPAPARLASRPGAPVRVTVPALGVDAAVDPVGLARGGVLVPPSDPDRLGWWAGGAAVGAPRGTAVVAGHSVHRGSGALDRLVRLEPGEDVVVRTGRGTVRYVVGSVRVVGRERLAREAGRLFDQEYAGGRLVLLTCSGWDGEGYRDNVVVTATPARRPAARRSGAE